MERGGDAFEIPMPPLLFFWLGMHPGGMSNSNCPIESARGARLDLSP